MENLYELKKRRKKVLTFSIDEEIVKKFNEIAKENGLNKSKVVESLIYKFIEEFNKKSN